MTDITSIKMETRYCLCCGKPFRCSTDSKQEYYSKMHEGEYKAAWKAPGSNRKYDYDEVKALCDDGLTNQRIAELLNMPNARVSAIRNHHKKINRKRKKFLEVKLPSQSKLAHIGWASVG